MLQVPGCEEEGDTLPAGPGSKSNDDDDNCYQHRLDLQD